MQKRPLIKHAYCTRMYAFPWDTDSVSLMSASIFTSAVRVSRAFQFCLPTADHHQQVGCVWRLKSRTPAGRGQTVANSLRQRLGRCRVGNREQGLLPGEVGFGPGLQQTGLAAAIGTDDTGNGTRLDRQCFNIQRWVAVVVVAKALYLVKVSHFI